MKIRDIYNSKAVALREAQVASNNIAYLGSILFPAKKKMGLDLKWVKTSKGLPVSLAPSEFDTKSTIRSREGIDVSKTQMAFFRESMLVTEEDEQDIMRVQEASDPYAQAVIDHVYNDAEKLIEGAKVVPERMIFSLLAPEDGTPKISINANGASYEYNYDPDNTFKTNNFTQLLGADMWNQFSTANPLEDVRTAQEAIEDLTGEKPTIMIIGSEVMKQLVKNDNIRNAVLAQSASANVFMTEGKVKQLFQEELGIEIIKYTKKYKNELGQAVKFFPDNFATLIPAGELGNTWFGTTPEERILLGDASADVSITNTGIAVAITTTSDPVNTKTTVSEIVLPSFERMDSVYVIKTSTDVEEVTGTVAEGTSAGTTKVTLESAGTGNSYKVSTTATALPTYGADLSSWTTYTSGSNITIADGSTFYIAKVDTNGLCIGAGEFTADSKS